MAKVKKNQKRKKGKLAKLIDCYSKDRSQCSIAFSEGDCCKFDTPIKTKTGIKEIRYVKVGDLVPTHTGEFKKVLVNKLVKKNEWVVKTDSGNMSFSKNHKHPIHNIMTGNIEIIETFLLDPSKHQLLKKR